MSRPNPCPSATKRFLQHAVTDTRPVCQRSGYSSVLGQVFHQEKSKHALQKANLAEPLTWAKMHWSPVGHSFWLALDSKSWRSAYKWQSLRRPTCD